MFTSVSEENSGSFIKEFCSEDGASRFSKNTSNALSGYMSSLLAVITVRTQYLK
jgi:hypothetical protein